MRLDGDEGARPLSAEGKKPLPGAKAVMGSLLQERLRFSPVRRVDQVKGERSE